MFAVTGASGQLGRLVVTELLKGTSPGKIVAGAREPSKLADLAAAGVNVRLLDYDKPETLGPALEGVKRLLLISGSDISIRLAQHRAVIAAAKAARVEFVAYTSILHAPTSPLLPAENHRQTEALFAALGVPGVMLRNAWYLENYTGQIPRALESGLMIGSAGEGRISAALRADYAAAAAAVLLSDENLGGRAFELAADESFTMDEFAADLTRVSGKTVAYRDMSSDAHLAALEAAKLPEGAIAFIVPTDRDIKAGALHDTSGDLSRLIGRPTVSWRQAMAEAVRRTSH